MVMGANIACASRPVGGHGCLVGHQAIVGIKQIRLRSWANDRVARGDFQRLLAHDFLVASQWRVAIESPPRGDRA